MMGLSLSLRRESEVRDFTEACREGVPELDGRRVKELKYEEVLQKIS